MERHRQREDRLAVLDRGDAAGGVALAVAQPLDLVDDRHLRIAGQDEIAMQRMRQPALDGAAAGDHRLADHLAAEHPLPRGLRAGAAEQVHLERFEIEDRNQVNQALGHRHSGLPISGAAGVRAVSHRVRCLIEPDRAQPPRLSCACFAQRTCKLARVRRSRYDGTARHCHWRRRVRRAGAGAGAASGARPRRPGDRRRSGAGDAAVAAIRAPPRSSPPAAGCSMRSASGTRWRRPAQPIVDMVVTDSALEDATRPVFLTFAGPGRGRRAVRPYGREPTSDRRADAARRSGRASICAPPR